MVRDLNDGGSLFAAEHLVDLHQGRSGSASDHACCLHCPVEVLQVFGPSASKL